MLTKITFKKKKEWVSFDSIENGETFLFGKKLYIKTTYGRAFCYNDNQLVTFESETMVKPVISELVVYTEE